MTDLIARLVDAVRENIVPRPISGEPLDDYRFRVAHAGAMVALGWLSEQQVEPNDLEDDGPLTRATVTPLPVPDEARDA